MSTAASVGLYILRIFLSLSLFSRAHIFQVFFFMHAFSWILIWLGTFRMRDLCCIAKHLQNINYLQVFFNHFSTQLGEDSMEIVWRKQHHSRQFYIFFIICSQSVWGAISSRQLCKIAITQFMMSFYLIRCGCSYRETIKHN